MKRVLLPLLFLSGCTGGPEPVCAELQPEPLLAGDYRSTDGRTMQVTGTEVIVTSSSGEQRYRRPAVQDRLETRFERCGSRPEGFGYRKLEIEDTRFVIRAQAGAVFTSLDRADASFRCVSASCPLIPTPRVRLIDQKSAIEIVPMFNEDSAGGVATIELSWQLNIGTRVIVENKTFEYVPARNLSYFNVERCF
jgi:hypothetical protein